MSLNERILTPRRSLSSSMMDNVAQEVNNGYQDLKSLPRSRSPFSGQSDVQSERSPLARSQTSPSRLDQKVDPFDLMTVNDIKQQPLTPRRQFSPSSNYKRYQEALDRVGNDDYRPEVRSTEVVPESSSASDKKSKSLRIAEDGAQVGNKVYTFEDPDVLVIETDKNVVKEFSGDMGSYNDALDKVYDKSVKGLRVLFITDAAGLETLKERTNIGKVMMNAPSKITKLTSVSMYMSRNGKWLPEPVYFDIVILPASYTGTGIEYASLGHGYDSLVMVSGGEDLSLLKTLGASDTSEAFAKHVVADGLYSVVGPYQGCYYHTS